MVIHQLAIGSSFVLPRRLARDYLKVKETIWKYDPRPAACMLRAGESVFAEWRLDIPKGLCYAAVSLFSAARPVELRNALNNDSVGSRLDLDGREETMLLVLKIGRLCTAHG